MSGKAKTAIFDSVLFWSLELKHYPRTFSQLFRPSGFHLSIRWMNSRKRIFSSSVICFKLIESSNLTCGSSASLLHTSVDTEITAAQHAKALITYHLYRTIATAVPTRSRKSLGGRPSSATMCARWKTSADLFSGPPVIWNIIPGPNISHSSYAT